MRVRCTAGALATNDRHHYQCAVCGGMPLREGKHFVRCTIVTHGKFGELLGVVSECMSRQAASGAVAGMSGDGWMLDTGYGRLVHGGNYTGWPGRRRVQEGDVVGLLLDMDAGSLSVRRRHCAHDLCIFNCLTEVLRSGLPQREAVGPDGRQRPIRTAVVGRRRGAHHRQLVSPENKH